MSKLIRVILLFVGIALFTSIIYLALNSTDDHKAYELFPIELKVVETKNLDEIKNNPDLIKQNIIRIEDRYIALYPENMCASLTLEHLLKKIFNDTQMMRKD